MAQVSALLGKSDETAALVAALRDHEVFELSESLAALRTEDLLTLRTEAPREAEALARFSQGGLEDD